MSMIINCPRCGEKSYERLRTHSHCLQCLYSNDLLSIIDRSDKRDFLTFHEAKSHMKSAKVLNFLPRKKSDEVAS